jgi:Leucine-rich repeat (LRR) protein
MYKKLNFLIMKKNIFLIASLLVISIANSQIVNIPDAAFKAKLLSANTGNSSTWIAKNFNGIYIKIDSNSDGEIQVSEALQISTLNIRTSSPYIVTFVGIEAFTNLTYLFCNNVGPQAGLIDLTSLTQLQYLEINSSNPNLSINVSGLTNLVTLRYGGPQLNNPSFINQLINIHQLDCSYSSLTALNLSGLPNLKVLNCSNNLLNSLTLGGLTGIETLDCSNNQLSTLNLSGLTSFKTLTCRGNLFSSLNFLNGLTNVENVYFGGDNSNLTSIYLSNVPSLKTISSTSFQLTSITLDGLTNLETVGFGQNNELVSVNLNNLPNLKLLNFYNNVQLNNINFTGSTNLVELKADFNFQLSSLNLTNLTNLEKIDCGMQNLTSLNVNGLSNLKRLVCYFNNLTSLDLTGLSSLLYLDCSENELTSLTNIGANLQTLNCRYNQLTTLDVSPAVNNLYGMYCSYNNLTSLNIKNGRDEDLGIFPNPLEYICADTIQMNNVQTLVNIYAPSCIANSACNLSNETFAQKELISIYPNPVRDALTIDTTTTISEIMIYNSLGQIVKTIYNAENTKTIDVSNFNSGNYFMKIVTSSGVETQKFIKE